MERTTVGIWRVLAVVIAVALMVNAVQAVAGKAEFAWLINPESNPDAWMLKNTVVTESVRRN